MKLKLTLATATALGLLVAAASADNNWASVNQRGDGNSADVTQSSTGSNNQTRILQGQASAPGNNNIAIVDQDGTGNLAGFQNYGDSAWTLRQYGHNNLIDIEQDGRNNEVGQDNGSRYGGRSGNVNFGGAVGVQQTGSRNILKVEQSNAAQTYSENAVGAVRQTADINATETTNEINIVQEPSIVTGVNGPRHYVGFVKQTNTGPGTSAALKNLVDINQTGGGHPNPTGKDGNHVYNVTQNGTANSADLDQHGHTNRIRTVSQAGTLNEATVSQTGFNNNVASITQDNSGGGTLGNTISMTFNGDLNGNGSFGTGPAGALGLAQATVGQLGDDNLVDYDVTGNSNLFAFNQVGDGNTIDGEVNGNGNQVAIAQIGGNNTSVFTQTGGGNNLGVSQ